MWRHQELGFGAYSIALLNFVSYNVIEFAKSQVNTSNFNVMSDVLVRWSG